MEELVIRHLIGNCNNLFTGFEDQVTHVERPYEK